MSNKKCTLTNGTCEFGSCVGNDPGMCGINFEGPGTCSNTNAPHNGKCWFDQDCGTASCQPKNGLADFESCTTNKTEDTCPKEKCQWTAPTCQANKKKGIHQHINQTCDTLLNTYKKDVKCNNGYEAAVSSNPNYNGSINPQDITKRQPCGFVCNKSPTPPSPSPSKGMSTAAKVALGIAITSLVAVLVFLGYEAISKKRRR